MLNTFATVVKIEISFPDFATIFSPYGGVYIAPIFELVSKNINSFFSAYKYEASLKDLFRIKDVASVSVDSNRNYVKVKSIEALYKQNESFYLFEEHDILYIAIHFDNFLLPNNSIIFNTALYFSDRYWTDEKGKTCTHIFDMKVLSKISEIETADIEGNALQFETLETNEMTVTILNENGMFDDFDRLYGNKFTAYKINDNENIPISVFSGFVKKPEFSYLDTVSITAGDIRYSFSSEVPSRVFDKRHYPYLLSFPQNVKQGDETIDTVRTIAAGRGVVVKLTPIKYHTKAGEEEIVYEICDTTKNAIERIVERADYLDEGYIKPHLWFIEKGESESELTHNGKTISGDLEIFIPEFKDYDGKTLRIWSLDKNKGTLTVRGYNECTVVMDDKDNLYELFIEIDMPPYKALTFMRECLSEYENISYIAENFDVINWEKEEANSREIAIVLNE